MYAGSAPEKCLFFFFFLHSKAALNICWNHHPSERSCHKVFLKRIAKTDCEFMISRCEKHSQAVETPSIYCGPWIKLTTAFPWFMMRLCWNAMPFTTVCFYLYICCTRPLQLLIQTWCAFYTTHSIFPVNSCVSLLH